MPLGQRHRERDLGMADQVFDLGRAQVRVDRYDGHAERIEREPVQEERRAVLE